MPTVSESDNRRIVGVSLGDRSYEIIVGQNFLKSSGESILNWLTSRYGGVAGASACIITDANVRRHAEVVRASLDEQKIRTTLFEMEPGEQSKRLEVISAAWDHLIDFQADRRTVVVAVGGGVVGDAAGFVAAGFMRGVPFVQVPTTLLADVDSSVGGKVGINHPQAKNMIGAFHQPLGVLIDTAALETLPDREYRAGLAEVVKYGVILDAPFFEFLERNVTELNCRDPGVVNYAIARSCELKAEVVEQDEYEQTGLRAILNYGHTFAHAYEALTGYGELLHGEAVAIGMLSASRLAQALGRIDADVTRRQYELLKGLRLPVQLPHPEKLKADDVLHRMQLDKKTVGGQLRFVLPSKLGHVEIVKGVSPDLVRTVLAEEGIR
ncbi:3-dehydroquinate synthase [Planctomicrobium sp. SH661]|uniref:3-dehydroquinate synthase n=1 Tax=Planctomicrobium sp. SH661 TaxID=3448124 RepID=UPI003F5B9B2E